MWNHGVPWALKHFIDTVTQPGMAFSFDPEAGYSGLLKGKTAVVIYTGTQFNVSLTFIRPIISALSMGGVVAAVFYGLRGAIGRSDASLAQMSEFAKLASEQLQRDLTGAILSNAIATVAAILAGVVVYLIMLFVTRAINPEELRLLPKGEKLYRIYKKITKKFVRQTINQK